MDPFLAEDRVAFVFAHPGHELRLHGLLERTRPHIFVLTDGSGRTGRSRLDSTARTLERAGAKQGTIFGRETDGSLYQRILEFDAGFFVSLAVELAAGIQRLGIGVVVGDAAEGYNPAHDVCRLVVNAAIQVVARNGLVLRNLEFPLVADDLPGRDAAVELRLDAAALDRKLSAARDYPELATEVAAALARAGPESFRVERLWYAGVEAEDPAWNDEPPFYERHGEKRVAAGHYKRVLRYREHMAPLFTAVRAGLPPPTDPTDRDPSGRSRP